MSTLHVNIIQPNSEDTPSIHTATTGSFDRIQNAAHGGNLNIHTGNNIKLNALNNVEIRPGNALKASFFSAGNLRLNSPSSVAPSSILDVNGDITTTKITASGNISSSGNFIGSNFEVLGGGGDPTIMFGTNSDKIYFSSNTIYIAPDDTDILSISDQGTNVLVDGNLKVTSHITASVISASNNLITTTGSFKKIQNVTHLGSLDIHAHNNLELKSSVGQIRIMPGNALKASFFSAGNLRLNSPSSVAPSSILDVNGDINATEITASGNISSSGGTGSFGSLVVDGSSVDFSGLPTSDPGVAGRLYNDSGTIKISL